MQLVLGIRSGTGALPPAGAPAPGPWLHRARVRRALRRIVWAASLCAITALGVIQGARVAIGAQGVSALARGELGGGTLERDVVRGALWRPADSDAERPLPAARGRRWEPARP